jgi:hypothetical protein
MVPGCPKWSVTDTVAHLAAVAAEVVSGQLTAIPTEEQTAVQVEQRRGRPLDEILAEWERAAGSIERALTARALPVALVHDVLTHEADLRGALAAGRPPESEWTVSLDLIRDQGWLSQLGELTVRAGERHATMGSGAPATTVEVEPYEFWRAVLGRRSRAQMTAWPWSGDPERYLQAIPVFGPTETDLTEPDAPGATDGAQSPPRAAARRT